jgi:hypothetical protein
MLRFDPCTLGLTRRADLSTLLAIFHGPLAQSVEQRTLNPKRERGEKRFPLKAVFPILQFSKVFPFKDVNNPVNLFGAC